MSITIIRKKIKNLYLRISPQGTINVSAPMRMSLSDIHDFIASRSSWIERQQTKLLYYSQKKTTENKYCNDEIHYFLGKTYKLKVIAHLAKPSIHLTDEHILMHVHPYSDNAKKQTIFEKWYNEQLKIKTHELVQHWERRMDVLVKQIKIRKMKTRWGSCSPHSQSIRINLELAKKPIECLEYIVVHELAHLLEASHNKRFVRLMDHFLPDWKIRKKELKVLL